MLIWRAGFDARLACKPRDANPSPRGSREEFQWDDGWLYATAEIARAGTSPIEHPKKDKLKRWG